MPAAVPSGARRRAVRAVGTAGVVVLAAWGLGGLLGGPDDAASGTGSAGGTGVAEPGVTVLPLGAVVEPDGARGPVPDDLVGWLQRHPRVTVLGVRRIRASGTSDLRAGIRAVTVDYELAGPGPTEPAFERLLGLPLLCPEEGGCARLVPGVRVRTTFVTGPDGVTAVQTRWSPAAGDRVGLLPDPLRTVHRQAALEVVRRLAGVAAAG